MLIEVDLLAIVCWQYGSIYALRLSEGPFLLAVVVRLLGD